MKKIQASIILMLGVLALSTSAIFVRIADAPAAVTAFYRLLFALLVLLPAIGVKKDLRRELAHLEKKQWVLTVLSGIFLAIHYILWFESLRFTSTASSTVIVTLQPLFTIALGFLFFRERLSRPAAAGCLIAIFGSFIIGYGDFRAGGQALLGDVMALMAAGFIAVYFFIGQILRKNMSATVYTVLGYSGSVIFLLGYAWLRGDAMVGYPAETWGAFLGIALISTILGQFIFNLLLRWLSATTIATGVLGEPVGTCILAALILHEGITLRQGIGMAVILGGLMLYFTSPAPKDKS